MLFSAKIWTFHAVEQKSTQHVNFRDVARNTHVAVLFLGFGTYESTAGLLLGEVPVKGNLDPYQFCWELNSHI
jgi:hypothetical protein